jgi:Zn-dependent protease with chaperone function
MSATSALEGRAPTRFPRARIGRFARAAAPGGPGQRAAARIFVANVGVGVFALASVAIVLTRLVASWRVGSGQRPDVVTLFGQRLSYPAANAGAIVIATLATLGLLVIAATVRSAARELRAERRFRRAFAAPAPGRSGGVAIIESDTPQAFCAGLLRPRVYLSRGALELLDADELAAVLEHEQHHAQRRDPLRLASSRVLSDALFFLPGLQRLVARQQALAEIGADEAAVAATGGDRAAMAGAMLRFAEVGGAEMVGLDPERVDHLIGDAPQWRLPLVLLAAIGACLSVLVASAVLAAETASGTATLALPFLSSQPCVVMLALIPAGVALAGTFLARALPKPRRLRASVSAPRR